MSAHPAEPRPAEPGAAEPHLPEPHGAERGPARLRRSDRGVVDLVRELSNEGADLARQEIALAKAEIHEKLDVFQRNLISMAVGGAFLLAALLFAVWAVNTGVTALMVQFMGLEIAVWLSPLLLGAALAVVGWGMIQRGQRAIRDEGITPHRTKETLEDDKRWAERKAGAIKHDIEEGVKHG